MIGLTQEISDFPPKELSHECSHDYSIRQSTELITPKSFNFHRSTFKRQMRLFPFLRQYLQQSAMNTSTTSDLHDNIYLKSLGKANLNHHCLASNPAVLFVDHPRQAERPARLLQIAVKVTNRNQALRSRQSGLDNKKNECLQPMKSDGGLSGSYTHPLEHTARRDFLLTVI